MWGHQISQWFGRLLLFSKFRSATTQVQDPLISGGLRELRSESRAVITSDLFWLIDAQTARLEPYFPKSHGKSRVDDGHVLSGTIPSVAMGCVRVRPRRIPPAQDALHPLEAVE